MRFLLFLIGLLPEHASAVSFDIMCTLGPGTQQMCDTISSVFPWTTTTGGGVAVITGKIVTAVMILIASVAVPVFIYAGIQIILSAGDESKLGEAKKTALYALLGLVFAILGQAIVSYAVALITMAAGG